jgi:valine--pyruvate aminotransferase
MEFSEFCEQFTDKAEITIADRRHGKAMSGDRLLKICADPLKLQRQVGIDNPPPGRAGIYKQSGKTSAREYGWPIGLENIFLTNGGHTGVFLLFNMFAGNIRKPIRLPLTPESIGYIDISLSRNFFVTIRPRIDYLEDHLFNYRVNFDAILPG